MAKDIPEEKECKHNWTKSKLTGEDICTKCHKGAFLAEKWKEHRQELRESLEEPEDYNNLPPDSKEWEDYNELPPDNDMVVDSLDGVTQYCKACEEEARELSVESKHTCGKSETKEEGFLPEPSKTIDNTKPLSSKEWEEQIKHPTDCQCKICKPNNSINYDWGTSK